MESARIKEIIKCKCQMGGSASSTKQISDIIGSQVMKNIYQMTNSCEQSITQKQSQTINVKGSVVGDITQNQTTTASISCLANNKFTELFDSNFKNKLQTDIANSISGVSSFGSTKSDIAQRVANMMFTESQIKAIQTTINNIDQSQEANINIENSIVGRFNQSQAVNAILQQVSDVTKEAIMQSVQEQEMKVSQVTTVVGTDITAIATTAIKTVGEVTKAVTGAFMIGAVIFVVVLIAGVIGLIIIIKRNCGAIKTALNRAGTAIPVARIQLKILSGVMGMFCPASPDAQSKKNVK